MKYTAQFIIAGYSTPCADQVEHYSSLEAIRAALQYQHRQAERMGAGYLPSEAHIWRGDIHNIADIYPDVLAVIGPRGGVKMQKC